MRYLHVICLTGLLAANKVCAQTAPSAAEQMLNDMLRPKPSAVDSSPATRPASPPALEPVGYVPGASAGHLLREGSDIVARRGHLKKTQDSPYAQLIFDKSAGSSLPTMLVLPNLQLMSMEDAASATKKETLTFTISGMVTEYRGKNYILLEPGPDGGKVQSAAAAPQPLAHGPVSADQMLKDMLSAEKPAGAAPAASPLQRDLTSGPGAVSPKAPVLTVLPEQAQVFDRVCRLAPSSDGIHEELTFDADGSSLHDPPLIVLPNLKLMDLEKAAGDHTTRVRVTGLMTEYRGRNYILMQKVVVMPDSDRQF